MQIVVGQYTGDGAASQDITIGFQPEWLFLGGAANGATCWASSGMPGAPNQALRPSYSAGREYSGTFVCLTSMGFRARGAASAYPNQNGIVFEYVAVRDAGSGQLAFGSYTGDGQATKTIICGFQPAVVLVQAVVGGHVLYMGVWDTGTGTVHSEPLGYTAGHTFAASISALTATGFTVLPEVNTAGVVFTWTAFAGVANTSCGLTVVGNNDEERDLDLGLAPGFVIAGSGVTIEGGLYGVSYVGAYHTRYTPTNYCGFLSDYSPYVATGPDALLPNGVHVSDPRPSAMPWHYNADGVKYGWFGLSLDSTLADTDASTGTDALSLKGMASADAGVMSDETDPARGFNLRLSDAGVASDLAQSPLNILYGSDHGTQIDTALEEWLASDEGVGEDEATGNAVFPVAARYPGARYNQLWVEVTADSVLRLHIPEGLVGTDRRDYALSDISLQQLAQELHTEADLGLSPLTHGASVVVSAGLERELLTTGLGAPPQPDPMTVWDSTSASVLTQTASSLSGGYDQLAPDFIYSPSTHDVFADALSETLSLLGGLGADLVVCPLPLFAQLPSVAVAREGPGLSVLAYDWADYEFVADGAFYAEGAGDPPLLSRSEGLGLLGQPAPPDPPRLLVLGPTALVARTATSDDLYTLAAPAEITKGARTLSFQYWVIRGSYLGLTDFQQTPLPVFTCSNPVQIVARQAEVVAIAVYDSPGLSPYRQPPTLPPAQTEQTSDGARIFIGENPAPPAPANAEAVAASVQDFVANELGDGHLSLFFFPALPQARCGDPGRYLDWLEQWSGEFTAQLGSHGRYCSVVAAEPIFGTSGAGSYTANAHALYAAYAAEHPYPQRLSGAALPIQNLSWEPTSSQLSALTEAGLVVCVNRRRAFSIWKDRSLLTSTILPERYLSNTLVLQQLLANLEANLDPYIGSTLVSAEVLETAITDALTQTAGVLSGDYDLTYYPLAGRASVALTIQLPGILHALSVTVNLKP